MSFSRELATIIFYDSKKRILIQDRRDRSKHGEEWGFFGGKVEVGETPEQAVVRECAEELSYALHAPQHIDTRTRREADSSTVTLHTFVAPMPQQGTSAFLQKEGRGMSVVSVIDAQTHRMVPGDHERLPAIQEALEKR